MHPRSRTTILLLLLLLSGVSPAAGDGPAAGPGGPDAAPATPRLDAALRRMAARGVRAGVLVTDARGRVLAERNADRPLVPASTMKLLTTACALDLLGPSWTTSTDFLVASAPDEQGRVAGPLWVRGGGDPLLLAEDLWAAVQELRALGVRAVAGLGADAGLFPGPPQPPSWRSRPPVPDPYAAPQGALSLAWNSLEVVVRPGATGGEPARVDVFPLRGAVGIVNRATTGPATSLRIELDPSPDHRTRIVVRGSIPPGAAPHREWVHLHDPARALLGGLRRLLLDAGIAVDGPLRFGTVPAGAREIVRRKSRPLAELVRAINKFSSNFGAEVLLRHLGATTRAGRRETAQGLEAVRACLDRWRVPRARLVLADGSGYAPADRLTARALVAVLDASRRHPEWGPELLVSLPRAAEDGSLTHRLAALAGRVRAKTGSLSGASALAGELLRRDGSPLLFAILVNGPPAAVPRQAADGVLVALAGDLDAAASTPPGGTTARP